MAPTSFYRMETTPWLKPASCWRNWTLKRMRRTPITPRTFLRMPAGKRAHYWHTFAAHVSQSLALVRAHHTTFFFNFDAFLSVTVEFTIQLVWFTVTQARNGFVMAVETHLGGQIQYLVCLIHIYISVNGCICCAQYTVTFCDSAILWTTWWEPSLRRWLCIKMVLWEKRCWSATTVAAVTCSFWDSFLPKLTLLWCCCAGEGTFIWLSSHPSMVYPH